MYGGTQVEKSTRFAPGITENCELLQGFTWENSKTDGSGQMCLTANFTNERGATFRKLFWKVDEDYVRKNNVGKTWKFDNAKARAKEGDPMTDKQAIDQEYAKFTRYISSIMHIFCDPKDCVIPETDTYESYSKEVISRMEGKTAGIKFRLKLTLNNRNFLQLPTTVNKNKPFIEPMSVPKEYSKLKIYDGEVVDYPKPDAEEQKVAEPTTNDPLPF